MKVTEIIKEQEVEGKFGPQTRTAFKVEGNDKIISAFSKFPLKIGQELQGTIETIEKEGKTYHNFKFTPKNPGVDTVLLNRKLDEIITKLDRLLGIGKQSIDAASLVNEPLDDVPF